jgi:hypothetical protein
MTTSADAPPRCCRTPGEALAAGMADGESDPPMTERQAALVSVLLRPLFEARSAVPVPTRRKRNPAAGEAA